MDVWTARLSTRDPDAFDVTRKSGHGEFAPSWVLLRRMLDIRAEGRTPTDAEWKSYAFDYLREMEVSYRDDRASWLALLARDRVVLTCFCVDPQRCHRTLLGRVLAHLGATYHGELGEAVETQTERDLFAMVMGEDDD